MDMRNIVNIAKELNKIEACDFNTKQEALDALYKILKTNGVTREKLHLVPYSLIQPYMAQVREME